MQGAMKRVSRRVEFIEKQKERASRFLKRRTGLINKAKELSILCGVDACMIIKAPKEININEELVDTVWSSSSDSDVMVQKMIKKYKDASVEDRKNRVYSVSEYFVGKKRKAETELARLKKKNREDVKLSTWDSKFETMNEHELRNLANDLEIKIAGLKSRRELMKNKKIKMGTETSYESSPRVDHQSLSAGNVQQVSMMEPNNLIPIGMKMVMNSIDDNYNVQPNANPIGVPMFDQYTATDSQPQFSYSSMMNGAMMSADVPMPVPESFVYDHNAYNFSVFGCLSMQQGYVYRNYRMENSVQRQSFYDLPPLPPLMIDHSTNGHVSSQTQMQNFEQQPDLPYNFP